MVADLFDWEWVAAAMLSEGGYRSWKNWLQSTNFNWTGEHEDMVADATYFAALTLDHWEPGDPEYRHEASTELFE
jgi:hypothetical protein